ncbi:hypothetical protein HBH70_204060 [Parastagonospora nodorum]|nr:hypothetical protein HBH43_007810 [Parastagonospora nodorum]KAH4895136.1 hypothetical protein HBI80_222960 [Parastagonospora nodorum]KAH5129126.1 hypothetical protein HBH70_204060 [Parastagonospora nodorum]KAH5513438.1 hypothetical protein HBI31_014510 [Parastagonospora nodorum]KAH5602421.1 hypothetical protein HBI45_129070 [Parastagonospora nodorum]
MDNQSAECSAAVMSCSAPAAAFVPKRVRWATEPTYHHSHNEASPAATSTPIDIPYPDQTYNMPKGSRMAPRKPTAIEHRYGEDRIHHKLDNVTDYCKRGYYGWEFAHDKRIERSNKGIGKIISGERPNRKTWYIPAVVRKDVDFEDIQESTGEWEDEGYEVTRNGKRKAYAKDDFSDGYRKHVAGRKLKIKAEAFERRNALRRLEFGCTFIQD